MIDLSIPATWQDLQEAVATVLRESGLEADVERPVQTVRGTVTVDVWAVDRSSTPAAVIVCECKHWRSAVPQHVVHGFRTVLSDTGANIGLLVSTSRFQQGALEAAAHSNLRLVNWHEFQSIFEVRWFSNWFIQRARSALDPLIEYTEPINTRVFRKADSLTQENRTRFRELREELHLWPAALLPLLYSDFFPANADRPPDLPLGRRIDEALGQRPGALPDTVFDALDLRSLLTAIEEESAKAVQRFDEIFGERA